MVPVEVRVAEEGGMDGGDVGLHSAFRNHCTHSFPARLLPFVMSSVSLFWLWCCLPDLNRQVADSGHCQLLAVCVCVSLVLVNHQAMAHRVFMAAF